MSGSDEARLKDVATILANTAFATYSVHLQVNGTFEIASSEKRGLVVGYWSPPHNEMVALAPATYCYTGAA